MDVSFTVIVMKVKMLCVIDIVVPKFINICQPFEIPALALKSVLKPQLLPALYQIKLPNARIVLAPVSWLAAKSDTVDIGISFIAR